MEYVALVGACYIDTILDTPTYPTEDSKLRATHLSRRRGGNAPNTAEVLGQYARQAQAQPTNSKHAAASQQQQQHKQWNPLLVSVLPERGTPDDGFIRESLVDDVVLEHCIERPGRRVAPLSYIVRSKSSGSRTIVNYSELEEMTVDEFCAVFDRVGSRVRWWHFEGRIPETAIQCIRYVREKAPTGTVISVEVEKPGREGLLDMALLADFVFFSRSWVIHAGFTDLKAFLESQSKSFESNDFSHVKCIYCTWGAEGAGSVLLFPGTPIVHTFPAAPLPLGQQVVDTVGAGDTFVAVIISLLLGKEPLQLMDTVQALVEANAVCARKVTMEGLKGVVKIK